MSEKPSFSAKMWFAWGQSCAYWGNKTMIKTLYRWAIGSFSRALKHAPTWSLPLLRRAVIRGRELDDYAGAVRDLTTLIDQDPEWHEPYLQRGILHTFHGFHAAQRAIDDFQQFLERAPATHTWRDEAERLIKRLENDIAERQAIT